MRAIFRVLAQPGLARLYLCQVLIYGQLFLSFTILPLYTEQLGGTAWTVGLHTTIFTGVALLLRFFLAPLADTHGRKPLLLGGAFVYATTNLLLLLSGDLLSLGLIRAYQAIGLAAYAATSSALILDLAPPDARGIALSLNRGALALALLLFPMAGEQVVHSWGFPTLFLLAFIAAAAGFVLILKLPAGAQTEWATPFTAATRTQSSDATDFSSGGLLGNVAVVLARPGVPVALAAMGVTAISHVGATSFLPLRLAHEGGAEFGPYFVAVGIAAFLAGLTGGLTDQYGPRVMLLIGLLLVGTGAAGLYVSVTLPVLLLCGVIIGAGYTLSASAAPNWIDRSVPRRLRATALGLTETTIDLSLTIGFPALGALSTSLGYASGFAAMALLCLGVLLMLLISRNRSMPGLTASYPAASGQTSAPTHQADRNRR